MVVVAAAVFASLTLAEVLERSARYVADYQERLSSVVAEERYNQLVDAKTPRSFGPFSSLNRSRTVRSKRQLKSDYLLVRAPGQVGWVPFRDVYEVDGKPVRDRDERLLDLFVDTPATAWDQAAAIASESSRFNIGSVNRNINVPTLALIFLTGENQPRFEFHHEDTSGDTWEITYRERGRPTLISGHGGADLPAFGTFWIDANDGRLLRSRFRTDTGPLSSDINVTYELDRELGFLVPSKMQEEYRTSTGETIEGTATYGRFRQFTVRTSERIR